MNPLAIERAWSRRDVLRAGAVFAGLSCVAPACRRKVEDAGDSVTLYTSVDAGIARPVIDAFERRTGIKVRVVTDTEATKTAGLTQRLVAEKSSPRADVWWSSEVLGTITLAQQGLLQLSEPRWLREEFGGSWPGGLCDSNGLWWGVAQRPRVVVRSRLRVSEADAPWSLDRLITHEPKGRVGIAQPQFGTTRSHFAALAVLLGGIDALRDLLRALKKSGVRLYPGNSAVVRAVAHGEIDLGLTDTDDVWAGPANGWPVELVYPPSSAPRAEASVLIPCTVAKVAGKAPTQSAQQLIDFLTSAECERLLATGESGNFPIRDELRVQLARVDTRLREPGRVALLNWMEVGEIRGEVDSLLNDVFPP